MLHMYSRQRLSNFSKYPTGHGPRDPWSSQKDAISADAMKLNNDPGMNFTAYVVLRMYYCFTSE
jgi:hypothetical protein